MVLSNVNRNANRVEISPSVDGSKYYMYDHLEEESNYLGNYTSKEKALKVLDAIQKEIEYPYNSVFQMPQDDEVEV